MRFFIICIICALSIGPTQCAFAQTYHVSQITTEQGLSHGYVSSLMQDSRGFIWIGTIYGLNRYDGYQCKSYLPNLLDDWSLHASIITSILEDQNGLLWLGTDDGITLFNPISERFIELNKIAKNAPAGITRKLIRDEDNNIWCLQLRDTSIYLYHIVNSPDLSTFSFDAKVKFPSVDFTELKFPSGFGNQLRFFSKTNDFTCLIANQEKQFLHLDLRKKTFSPANISLPLYLNGTGVTSFILPDHDFSNRLGADDRFGVIKSANGKVFLCQFFEQRIFSLTPGKYPEKSTEIGSLPVVATIDQPQSPARIIDRNGKIWVGTIGDGVRIIEATTDGITQQLSGLNLCNPSYMPDGNLWAGMYEPNKVVNLKSGQISLPLWSSALPPGAIVNASYYDSTQQAVYLIVNLNQKLNLSKFDIPQRNFVKIEDLYFNTQDPVVLFKDSKENLWVAGIGGEVLRHSLASGVTNHWNLSYLSMPNHSHGRQMSRCIAEDKAGRIWIGSDGGLTRITFKDNQPEFRAFNNYGESGPILRSEWIFSLYPDPNDADIIWLGTLSGGLAKFNCGSGKVTYLTEDSKPGFNLVTGILPDSSGNLWLATDKGVFKYQYKKNIFVDISSSRNIPKMDFNAAAYLKNKEGNILFGGANGLININPSKIEPQTTQGELIITQLGINGESISECIHKGKIDITNQKQYKLNLSYNDNLISISFAMPAANNPQAIVYRYRIKENNDNWIHIGQSNTLTFNEINPGNYTLEVQAIGEGETWDGAKVLYLPIRVNPPWYRSDTAFFSYFLVLATLIWMGFRFQRNRLALQYLADLSQKEVERLHSMDAFKNRFFAYIAHEFKTPLTIIMGAGEQLKSYLFNDKSNQYPQAIIRESNNMLNLINEIIDVTRFHDKSLQLHYEKCEMVAFFKHVLSSYEPLAVHKKINLNFDCSLNELFIEIDPQRTQYIINNLLSNAIQNTQLKGSIVASLKSDAEFAVIEITDNGKGISPENLPHIFDKYFTTPEKNAESINFGLGLSFVKELTGLMKGDITAESTPGIKTTFKLTLPVKAPAGIPIKSLESNYLKTPVTVHPKAINAPLNAPHLLIVDDNANILSYLKSILQPHFQLSIATNGLEGLESAIQEIPDLILTDVMMPEMDGIEMTQRIKAHQLTNHIPIVMLSAKNEVADRIKGQQQGADVYLGKPFNEQELMLTLHNLFQLQNQWKKRYSSLAAGSTTLEKVADMPEGFDRNAISQNDSFMQAILNVFENNYGSENFDVYQLASIMNISKAQLYRKLSKISEEGVMGLLRNYRLQKAVEMLENHPNLSTKEIAYRVGFREYSHFSVSFKKHFNINPSEWRKKNSGNNTTP